MWRWYWYWRWHIFLIVWKIFLETESYCGESRNSATRHPSTLIAASHLAAQTYVCLGMWETKNDTFYLSKYFNNGLCGTARVFHSNFRIQFLASFIHSPSQADDYPIGFRGELTQFRMLKLKSRYLASHRSIMA